MLYYWYNREKIMVSLNTFYTAVGYTKQGLHQHLNSELARHSLFENVYKIIVQIRHDHPTLNCKAMYYKIKPEGIGRCKFEHLCNEWGLTQEKRINRTRTTFSSGVIRFDNLYKDAKSIKEVVARLRSNK